MQAVLDAPVAADSLGQDGRIVLAAGKEVADLSLGLAGAAANCLDRQQRAQIGPFVQGLELCVDRAHEEAAAHQATVAVIKGVACRPAAGAAAETGTFEMFPYGVEGAAVIGL